MGKALTAKPKRDVRLPKTSLLERLEKSLDGYVSRLKMVEALQDKHDKDLAWLKACETHHNHAIVQLNLKLDRVAKPNLWPLWTVLIVELAGLGALFAKVYGYAPY